MSSLTTLQNTLTSCLLTGDITPTEAAGLMAGSSMGTSRFEFEAVIDETIACLLVPSIPVDYLLRRRESIVNTREVARRVHDIARQYGYFEEVILKRRTAPNLELGWKSKLDSQLFSGLLVPHAKDFRVTFDQLYLLGPDEETIRRQQTALRLTIAEWELFIEDDDLNEYFHPLQNLLNKRKQELQDALLFLNLLRFLHNELPFVAADEIFKDSPVSFFLELRNLEKYFRRDTEGQVVTKEPEASIDQFTISLWKQLQAVANRWNSDRVKEGLRLKQKRRREHNLGYAEEEEENEEMARQIREEVEQGEKARPSFPSWLFHQLHLKMAAMSDPLFVAALLARGNDVSSTESSASVQLARFAMETSRSQVDVNKPLFEQTFLFVLRVQFLLTAICDCDVSFEQLKRTFKCTRNFCKRIIQEIKNDGRVFHAFEEEDEQAAADAFEHFSEVIHKFKF